MWRTGVTLLLVSLAVNAIQNADHIQFVNENSIMGKGPVRVVKNSDTLVADVPVEQKSKPEEPKQEDESTLSRAFRVIRSNAVPHALKLAGLGQGNQLADAQPTHTITTSGNTFTISVGKTVSTNVTVQFSLDKNDIFVYGKANCEGTKCKATSVVNTFDESKSTPDTTITPTTFSFNGGNNGFGWVKGSNYQDQVKLNDFVVSDLVFGVATSGNNTDDAVDSPAEGFMGLGFRTDSGPAYSTITKLLNAVAPNRALTIWRDSDLKAGVLHFGGLTYEKCPKTLSSLVNTTDSSSDKTKRWWFSADKVEVDGVVLNTQVVEVDLDSSYFNLPQSQYEKIMKAVGTDGVTDPNKLPAIKITIGKDVIELGGSTYTVLQDKKYAPQIFPSFEKSDTPVRLGQGILKKLCVILKQTDDKGTALQMGFAYGNFSPSSMSVSVFGLIMLPLVYLMGL